MVPTYRPLSPAAYDSVFAVAVWMNGSWATVAWAPVRAWADEIAIRWMTDYERVEIWHEGQRVWSSMGQAA